MTVPHEFGEKWGYDIIGSETHPFKEVFELHCKIRKLDFDEESDEESDEDKCKPSTRFSNDARELMKKYDIEDEDIVAKIHIVAEEECTGRKWYESDDD